MLNRVLGELLDDSHVYYGGTRPHATWMVNSSIKERGLCWREIRDGGIEIACTFVLKGNVMLRYGNIINVVDVEEDVHVLIRL